MWAHASFFTYSGRNRRWTVRRLQASSSWCRPPSALHSAWNRALSHCGAGQWRVGAPRAGPLTAQAAAPGPGLCQTTARQNSVHLRATGGSGKQVPHDSLPVRVRKTKPGTVPEPDRNPGENLVPEQEDQMEKAEPRGGQHLAARLQLIGQRQSKSAHVWVKPRQLPPNFRQLQLWECYLPHGRWCSAFIHWGALASLYAQWFRPADLF